MMVEQLNKILEIKADIKSALIKSGVSEVGDKFDTYPGLIKGIEIPYNIYATFFSLVPGEYLETYKTEDGHAYRIKCLKYRYIYSEDIFVCGPEINRKQVDQMVFPNTLAEIKSFVNELPTTDRPLDLYTSDISDELLKYNSVYIAYVTTKGYNVNMKDRTYKAHDVWFGACFDSAEHRNIIITSYYKSGWNKINTDDYGILTKEMASELWPGSSYMGIDGASKPYITTMLWYIKEADIKSSTNDVYLDGFPLLTKVYIYSDLGPKGHYGSSPLLTNDNIIYNPETL